MQLTRSIYLHLKSMGQELDPFRACCCANVAKIDNVQSGGSNTTYEYGEYGGVNSNWIIKIQATWRSKLQRMKYLKTREESRKNSKQFLIGDTMETVSKREVIMIDLLRYSSEAELQEQLEVRVHRYRTSGATYDGQWLGGLRHGRGVMSFKDGTTYEGTWYLGYAHGYGKFTQVKGETYEGEWAYNMYHGKGMSTHVNFFVYEGQFRKGIMQGIGKETYPDGT